MDWTKREAGVWEYGEVMAYHYPTADIAGYWIEDEDEEWQGDTGPGWYLYLETPEKTKLLKGPFKTLKAVKEHAKNLVLE